MGRKLLLGCGIASSRLYIATVVLAPLRWAGYSPFSQTVSELFAIGAPSRSLVVPLFLSYSILIFAFGVGVWRSAGDKRALRVAACLIVGKEVLGFVGTLCTPIHLRGVAGTLTDTMHAILTGLGVLLFMFPAIVFGAMALGKWFRLYSLGTGLIFLVFGVLAGLDGPRLAANLPTLWMGVWERINIFGYMLWIVVLAVMLLRAPVERFQELPGVPTIAPGAAGATWDRPLQPLGKR